MTIEIREMTREELKAAMEEVKIMANLSGFNNWEDMYDFRHFAAEGMIKFGGSFTHSLGHALARADAKNSAILMRAFKEDCAHHAELYKKWLSNLERQRADSAE